MRSRNLKILIPVLLQILCFAVLIPAYASSSVESLVLEQKPEIFAKGALLYEKHCVACHAASNIMVSSPKFGDRVEWTLRLNTNKNLKGLAKSAFKGKGAMPPKGLCSNCNKKDLEAAIVYMMKGE